MTSLVARCLGLILLAVVAFVPLGNTFAGALESKSADEVSAQAARQLLQVEGEELEEDEEDCEELVSHDMVLCGDEYFDAADLEDSGLYMPREQCLELLELFALDLECDPNDSECRERLAQRGDAIPQAQRTLRVLHMVTLAMSFPDLLCQRGVATHVSDWDVPSSLGEAPSPRPPRLA